LDRDNKAIFQKHLDTMKIIVYRHQGFTLQTSYINAALTIFYLKQALTNKFLRSTLVEWYPNFWTTRPMPWFGLWTVIFS